MLPNAFDAEGRFIYNDTRGAVSLKRLLDESLWLCLFFSVYVSRFVTGRIVMLTGAARTTARSGVNVLSNWLLVTPTNVVDKVRAYRRDW